MLPRKSLEALDIPVCYRRLAVESNPYAVDFKGGQGFSEGQVFNTYKIESLADWAKNLDIREVFPGIVLTIDEAGKTQMN